MTIAHLKFIAERDARALLALCSCAHAPAWKVREIAADNLRGLKQKFGTNKSMRYYL